LQLRLNQLSDQLQIKATLYIIPSKSSGLELISCFQGKGGGSTGVYLVVGVTAKVEERVGRGVGETAGCGVALGCGVGLGCGTSVGGTVVG
jgi:hypothetical protein